MTQADDVMLVGRTRLQKLLFLVAQHLKPDVAARFEAYNYGPFQESVATDVEFLASEGLIDATGHEAIPTIPRDDADRGREALAWIRGRSSASKASPDEAETYRLTAAGMAWVRRFLDSDEFGPREAKERLWAECVRLKADFGRIPQSALVEYVYANYPEFTARSKIKSEVEARIERRRHDH
jgi:hypothetical protein